MLKYKLSNAELGKTKDFLIFSLGHEEYAIDTLKIREICCYTNVATIANLPCHIKGIKRLADKMALILDLRVLFHSQSVSYDEYTLIIIIQLAEHCFGLIVNEVKEVLTVLEENISFIDDLQSLIRNHYIQKMARIDHRLLFILDIENLYHHEVLHLTDKHYANLDPL